MDQLLAEIHVSKQHLAHRLLAQYGWQKFQEELKHQVNRKLVEFKKQNDLVIYNYTDLCKTKDQWSLWNVIARSLIVDVKKQKIVSTSFSRFFNFHQLPEGWQKRLVKENVKVVEKLDGSLISLFYDEGWHFSSRFSFQSPQVKYAENLKTTLKNLDPKLTYIFEAVYVENNIIVEYSSQDEGLYLIGAYDNQGYEVSDLEALADLIGARKPQVYAFTNVQEVIENAKTLDVNHEGYVCQAANGMRFKVKSVAYLEVCHVKSIIGHKKIWQELKQHKNIDAFLEQYPSVEAQNYLKGLRDKYLAMTEEIFQNIAHDYQLMYYPDISYKEMIQQKIKLLPQLTPDASQCFRLLKAEVKLDDDLMRNIRDVSWNYAMTHVRTKYK